MKVQQTKKAKEEFYSPVLQLITTNAKTSDELSLKIGVHERTIRDEINGISKHYAVIRGSFYKGYRLAKDFSTLTLEEMEEEAKLVQRTINEFNARIKDMKKPQKPLIAYLKALEKEMFKQKQNKK